MKKKTKEMSIPTYLDSYSPFPPTKHEFNYSLCRMMIGASFKSHSQCTTRTRTPLSLFRVD